jgi:hypothetical protein
MTESYDLNLVQGETFSRTFAWRLADGTYANLNDYQLRAQIRQREDPRSALLLDLAGYMVVANEDASANGGAGDGKLLVLLIPGRITAPMESRQFKAAAWDLFAIRTNAPDDSTRVLYGNARMDPAATDLRT